MYTFKGCYFSMMTYNNINDIHFCCHCHYHGWEDYFPIFDPAYIALISRLPLQPDKRPPMGTTLDLFESLNKWEIRVLVQRSETRLWVSLFYPFIHQEGMGPFPVRAPYFESF